MNRHIYDGFSRWRILDGYRILYSEGYLFSVEHYWLLCTIMIYIRVMHSRAMKHVVSISDHRAGWVLKPNWGEWGCQRFWPHIMFRLASQMSIDDYLTQTDEDVDISSATWLSMMYPSLGWGLVVPDELKLMIDVSCWRTHGSFFLLGLELMLVWSFLRKWAKRAEGTPLIGLRVSPYVTQNFQLDPPENMCFEWNLGRMSKFHE